MEPATNPSKAVNPTLRQDSSEKELAATPARKPKNSLRSTLTFWFLLFSIAPLAFVSGYSTVKYENSINSELQKRLEGNVREVLVGLTELEAYLENYGSIHASDPTLTYHLALKNIPAARRVVSDWLRTYSASKIILFDAEGKLLVAQAKGTQNDVVTLNNLETGEVYLADNLLAALKQKGQVKVREIHPGRNFEVVVYTKVYQKNNQVAGYLEEVMELGPSFVGSLKKRLNLEAILFDDKGNAVVSSREDFLLYPKDFFPSKVLGQKNIFFDLSSRGEPFGILVRTLNDQQGQPMMTIGLAASKLDAQKVLRRINLTLLTISILVFIIIIPFLIYVSNGVVRPINQLVEATRKMEAGQVDLQLRESSETEIGLLIDSFNRMARAIHSTQRELQEKVQELEKANDAIKDTQTHLVHAAKMASLGQLVAGVAHELNNPIGFIYSNMGHLRDYAEKIKEVIEDFQKNPDQLEKIKKAADLDYILEDLPRIIKSCEDGAKRTRDIVLGLRNFSRLDEAQLKPVSLKDGIENTITLLSGELKNRVTVHRKFGDLPEVKCFASQLNQVFMNIITNAAQSIEGKGDIWIETRKDGEWAQVSIRDSGKGISPEVVDKIFDPFFTTKPVGQGTGLGLSLSYGIIERHGGQINVLTKLNEGTEFVIRIPIDGPPDAREAAVKIKRA